MLRTVAISLLALAGVAPGVLAQGASEQERLAAIARELELVRALVEVADRPAPEARLLFDYDALDAELARLEAAVRAHLSLMNSVPRSHWDLSRSVSGPGAGS